MTATRVTRSTTLAPVQERTATWPWHRIVMLARALAAAARRGVARAQMGPIDDVRTGRATGARR